MFPAIPIKEGWVACSQPFQLRRFGWQDCIATRPVVPVLEVWDVEYEVVRPAVPFLEAWADGDLGYAPPHLNIISLAK